MLWNVLHSFISSINNKMKQIPLQRRSLPSGNFLMTDVPFPVKIYSREYKWEDLWNYTEMEIIVFNSSDDDFGVVRLFRLFISLKASLYWGRRRSSFTSFFLCGTSEAAHDCKVRHILWRCTVFIYRNMWKVVVG